MRHQFLELAQSWVNTSHHVARSTWAKLTAEERLLFDVGLSALNQEALHAYLSEQIARAFEGWIRACEHAAVFDDQPTDDRTPVITVNEELLRA